VKEDYRCAPRKGTPFLPKEEEEGSRVRLLGVVLAEGLKERRQGDWGKKKIKKDLFLF